VFNSQAAANIGGSALSKMNRSGGSGGRAFRHFTETPQKFARGGKVKDKGKKDKDKKDKDKNKGGKGKGGKDVSDSPTATAEAILGYLRDVEVTEKRYTGKVTLDESTKVRKVLKDAYEKKPDRDTLDAFLKANDLYWQTATSSRSGVSFRPAAGDGLPGPSPTVHPQTGPKGGPKPVIGPVAPSISRIWPVRGRETTTYAGHDGVDINYGGGWDDDGDPIVAAAGGKVSYAGTSRGYGDAVFIAGPYGEVVYGHMSRRLVGTGQSVWPGKQIGNVGMTGRASAPHLHFGYPGGTTAGALSFLQGAAPFRIISTPPPGWDAPTGTVSTTPPQSNPNGNPGYSTPPPSNPNGNPGYNTPQSNPYSGPSKPDRERSDYNFSSMLKKGTYSLPGLIKYVGSHSWGDTKKRFDLTGDELLAIVEENKKRFENLGGKGQKFMKGYERAKAGREADADPEEEGEPKDNRTPLEIYLDNLSGDIRQQALWEQALTQFASWGFTDLVDGLLAEGLNDDPESGNFAAAIQAAGLGDAPFNVPNYAAAAQLNELFKQKGAFSQEDLANLMKMIAFLSANGGGLRDLARHLGVSDFTVVDLFEKAMKSGKLSAIAPQNLARLQGDITSYRAGTFYAATGGVVPGTGDGDTVPAMLTPGEFVIRKQAAKALGLNNLLALNNVQKFATGGPVLSPKISSLPTKATDGAAAKALSQVSGGISYTTIYDVDINNPVAEEGTRSLMKALQRQGTLGGAGRTREDG
jgi:murein DD-endopeptidase MepM/ murein hydrolase activator NlpD